MSLDDRLKKQGGEPFGPFVKSKLQDVLPSLIRGYLADGEEIRKFIIDIVPLSEAIGDKTAPQDLRQVYVQIQLAKARYTKY